MDIWGGWYSAERERAWDRNTLVNVFSTTKGLTAFCAHRLVEQGLLDVDAPVAQYWPEFAAAGKESIPVRMLLNHQAGMAAVRRPLAMDDLFNWETMTDALAEQEPWWTPGEQHGYHALTYGWLVGEVVRRIDGRSLGTYWREEFAAPLGARCTHRHRAGVRRAYLNVDRRGAGPRGARLGRSVRRAGQRRRGGILKSAARRPR